jgi:hypothetical protein
MYHRLNKSLGHEIMAPLLSNEATAVRREQATAAGGRCVEEALSAVDFCVNGRD